MFKQAVKKEEILIVGGNASLASELKILLANNGLNFTETIRKKTGKANQINLDLRNVKNFNKLFNSNLKFDKIFVFIGSLSKNTNNNISFEAMKNYLEIYLINYIYLISILENALKSKSTSRLIIITSRSAKHGSRDPLYSIAKSGIEAWVKSRYKIKGKNQKTFCARFGLIIDSKMYYELTPSERNSHLKRSNFKLLGKKDLASKLWKISNSRHRSAIIQIGPDYQ